MSYFKLNKSQVVFENYDDEVVLINLTNGNYYSMKGVAAAIWAFVENGASINQVIDRMANKYMGNREEIASSVETFLMTLSGEGLVVKMDGDIPTSELTQDSLPVAARSTDKLPFEPPVLNRYTDMQDLILLDPVHEVDFTGWPNPKTDPYNP
jgi:hypothetical protein